MVFAHVSGSPALPMLMVRYTTAGRMERMHTCAEVEIGMAMVPSGDKGGGGIDGVRRVGGGGGRGGDRRRRSPNRRGDWRWQVLVVMDNPQR